MRSSYCRQIFLGKKSYNYAYTAINPTTGSQGLTPVINLLEKEDEFVKTLENYNKEQLESFGTSSTPQSTEELSSQDRNKLENQIMQTAQQYALLLQY